MKYILFYIHDILFISDIKPLSQIPSVMDWYVYYKGVYDILLKYEWMNRDQYHFVVMVIACKLLYLASKTPSCKQHQNMRVYKGFDWDTKVLPFIYLEMGYFALLVLYSLSSFRYVSAFDIILCLLFKLCNSIHNVYMFTKLFCWQH